MLNKSDAFYTPAEQVVNTGSQFIVIFLCKKVSMREYKSSISLELNQRDLALVAFNLLSVMYSCL